MAVKTKSCCFPHAGGDVSKRVLALGRMKAFSPRRWGCFRYCLERSWLRRVFPTQVGRFLSRRLSIGRRGSFPHAGGDVSIMPSGSSSAMAFSPRRWGCFSIFRFHSSYLVSFPHAGGDVSTISTLPLFVFRFSPRRWGCFHGCKTLGYWVTVFPTQVGMFLQIEARDGLLPRFSPRRWGCFRR